MEVLYLIVLEKFFEYVHFGLNMYLNTHTKSNKEHSEVNHEGNPTTAPKPVLMTYVGSSRSETKKSETISVSL